MDVVLQRQSEVSHELSAGGDAVAVKVGVVWLLRRKLRPLRLEFGTNPLNVLPLLSVDEERETLLRWREKFSLLQ